jgi:hypothetical protein
VPPLEMGGCVPLLQAVSLTGEPYGSPCALPQRALERCCKTDRKGRSAQILAAHSLLPRQARNRYDCDVLGRLAVLWGPIVQRTGGMVDRKVGH